MRHPEEFFRRAFYSHLLLCLASLFMFACAHAELRNVRQQELLGIAFPFAFVLFVMALIAAFITAFLLNWGKTAEITIVPVLIFNFVFCIGAVQMAAESPIRACLIFSGVKTVTLILFLAAGEFTTSFQEMLPELERRWEEEGKRQAQALKQQQEQAARDRQVKAVRGARAEAETFYRKHQSLIQDEVEPEMFRTALLANVPDNAEPQAAYDGAKKIIADLQVRVTKAKEGKRLEAQKQKQAADEAKNQVEEATLLDERLKQAQEAGDTAEAGELQSKLAKLNGPAKKKRIAPNTF
jgi:ABC-type multidrug transport system fused ATPase/permease subunit